MSAKQIAIGYDSLDLRKGESLMQVYGHVSQIFEDQPTIKNFYFDVIHNPDQTAQAMWFQEEIRQMIHEVTDLDGENINVRLSFNEQKLNARNDLAETLKKRNISNVNERKVKD